MALISHFMIMWGKCKFHDNEYFTKYAIIGNNVLPKYAIIEMTRMIIQGSNKLIKIISMKLHTMYCEL